MKPSEEEILKEFGRECRRDYLETGDDEHNHNFYDVLERHIMPMKDKARIVRWYEHLDEEIGK
jgi:hypothetical protein